MHYVPMFDENSSVQYTPDDRDVVYGNINRRKYKKHQMTLDDLQNHSNIQLKYTVSMFTQSAIKIRTQYFINKLFNYEENCHSLAKGFESTLYRILSEEYDRIKKSIRVTQIRRSSKRLNMKKQEVNHYITFCREVKKLYTYEQYAGQIHKWWRLFKGKPMETALIQQHIQDIINKENPMLPEVNKEEKSEEDDDDEDSVYDEQEYTPVKIEYLSTSEDDDSVDDNLTLNPQLPSTSQPDPLPTLSPLSINPIP